MERERDPASVRRTEPAAAADEGYPLTETDSERSQQGPSTEERARFLATHAAEPLAEAGLTEFRITELAREFAAGQKEGGVDEFVSWVRAHA